MGLFSKIGNFFRRGREMRHDRRMARITARTDRVEIRQANRTQRNSNRFSAHQVAYMNGIDPTADLTQMFSNVAKSAADMYAAGKGGGLVPGKRSPDLSGVIQKSEHFRDLAEKIANPNKMLMPLMLGILAIFLITKK